MINDETIDLISEFEGFAKEISPDVAVPYRCSAGYPTIGFGAIYGLDGNRVKMDHEPITREQAEDLLRRDTKISNNAVARLTQPYFHKLTENQVGALTSLTFNIGSGNFRASQIRSKLTRGEIESAGKLFWQWRRAGGRIVKGLVRRRAKETQLYFS